MRSPIIIIDFNRTLYSPERRRLMSGAREVLKILRNRGYILILVSQAVPGRAQCVRKLDIEKYFEQVVFVQNKSHRLFVRLLPKSKAARARCIVIGDRVRKEIVLGKALGCRTIWVKQGKFSDEGPRHVGEVPDITVRRLAAIPAVME